MAGVNGAGKSSIGGHLLERAGLAWFNPYTFGRELVADTGCEQVQANAIAWQEGMRRLDAALHNGSSHAFETTLGGRTVPTRILDATRSHDVIMWGDPIPDPTLVLEVIGGQCTCPTGAEAMARTPEWAKALVGAAIPQANLIGSVTDRIAATWIQSGCGGR